MHSEKCKKYQKLHFAKGNFITKLPFQKCNLTKLYCLISVFRHQKQPKAHHDGVLSDNDSKTMTKVWLNAKSLRQREPECAMREARFG